MDATKDAREFFGNDFLIERRFAPVKSVPRFHRDKTPVLNRSGKPVTMNVPNMDADGQPIWAWIVYQRVKVENKIHPYTGEETTDEYVWMPVGEFNTHDEARDNAKQLSGD